MLDRELKIMTIKMPTELERRRHQGEKKSKNKQTNKKHTKNNRPEVMSTIHKTEQA